MDICHTFPFAIYMLNVLVHVFHMFSAVEGNSEDSYSFRGSGTISGFVLNKCGRISTFKYAGDIVLI